MRRYLQLSPHAILDPFMLAKAMGVHILSLGEAHVIPEEFRRQLLVKDPGAWWGGCMDLPGGSALILYNPNQPPTRLNATLMEELAHIHLKHKKNTLSKINGNIVIRNYNKSNERQAYAVGAAALIPIVVLKSAHASGTSRRELAAERGVSLDLLEFREKVTGLKLTM